MPVGSGREIERPDLGQSGTSQMEQRFSVARKLGEAAAPMVTKASGSCGMAEHTAPPGLGKRRGKEFAQAMRRVVLANETDWEGWRKAARSLVLAGAAPEEVRWAVRSHDEDGDPLQEGTGSFGVSRSLVAVAALAIQAREPERFDLLYRLVWQANAGKPDEAEMRRAQGLALAVRAEAHRMRTHVRYLPVQEGNRCPLSRLV